MHRNWQVQLPDKHVKQACHQTWHPVHSKFVFDPLGFLAHIASKTHLSRPLKHVTIPRLELAAAVMAVKMDRMLRQELTILLQESIFWTEKTTVFRYLSNESARFKTFVANRVTTVSDHSHPTHWHYMNSELNPSDQGSRGVKVRKFLQNKVWIHGPDFLQDPESEWPKQLYKTCLTTCARVIMTQSTRLQLTTRHGNG